MFEIVKHYKNYDLPISCTSEIGKGFLLIYDYVVIYQFLQKLDINLLLSEKSFKIISYINIDDYVNELLISFKGVEDLEKQFIIDIPRCVMEINNHIVEDALAALNYIEYKYKIKHYNQIVSLCTQCIYAPIIEWIFFSLPNNYYVGEIAPSELTLKKKNHIVINNHKLVFRKNIRIFNIVKGIDMTKKIISVHLEIDNINDCDTDIEINLFCNDT